MDPQESFKNWYKTEGIRTPAPNGEHFHEFYQRIAYEAGMKAGVELFKKSLNQVEKAFRKL